MNTLPENERGTGRTIREGATLLYIPEYLESTGPSTSRMKVFYNPVMAYNRDISVLFFSVFSGIRKALDGLAASGARGIRVMNETEYSGEMYLNDRSERAVEIMRINAGLNGVEPDIHRENLNTLLSREFFDYVDIDPFGSPARFVPEALGSIRNGGVLAVTATDTGALSGTYVGAGLRRYGVAGKRGPLTHEKGVRALLSFLVRAAALRDRYIEPLLSVSTSHYYRVIVKVRNGAKRADRALKELRYLTHIGKKMEGFRLLSFEELAESPLPTPPQGPYFAGNIHSRTLIEGMIKAADSLSLQEKGKVRKYLPLYLQEANAPPFYYCTDRLSSAFKRSSPGLQRILNKLKESGYIAVRTQFSPTGFKTDAPFEVMREIFNAGYP